MLLCMGLEYFSYVCFIAVFSWCTIRPIQRSEYGTLFEDNGAPKMADIVAAQSVKTVKDDFQTFILVPYA